MRGSADVKCVCVALLDHAGGPYSSELAAALRDAGHEPRVVRSHVVAPVEALLRHRGFTTPLSHVPRAIATLTQGGFHLAHAFSAPEAVAALVWGRLAGRATAFTSTEALSRESASDSRLRLWSLRRAVEGTDALVASSEGARSSLERWFAVSPPVLAADDVAAHERLYRGLLAREARPN